MLAFPSFDLRRPIGWPSRVLALALFGAACAGAGYVSALRPPPEPEIRVVTREKVVTRQVTRRIVERTAHTLPSGETTVRETTREGIDTSTDAQRRADVEQRPAPAPAWRVSLQVGAAVGREPALQLSGPLVLGASVERRLAGPFSIGAWGSTAGAGGLSVSGEF